MRLRAILILMFFVLAPVVMDAQCSMCKAVAESSQQGGSSIADGLNTGIVYLMFFPYLLLGAVGFAIYKQKKSPRN